MERNAHGKEKKKQQFDDETAFSSSAWLMFTHVDNNGSSSRAQVQTPTRPPRADLDAFVSCWGAPPTWRHRINGPRKTTGRVFVTDGHKCVALAPRSQNNFQSKVEIRELIHNHSYPKKFEYVILPTREKNNFSWTVLVFWLRTIFTN